MTADAVLAAEMVGFLAVTLVVAAPVAVLLVLWVYWPSLRALLRRVDRAADRRIDAVFAAAGVRQGGDPR